VNLAVAWLRWLADVILGRHYPPVLAEHDNDGIRRIEDYRPRDWHCTACEVGWSSLMPNQRCPDCGAPAELGHVLLLAPSPK
jgi:rubrerythrin